MQVLVSRNQGSGSHGCRKYEHIREFDMFVLAWLLCDI